MEVDAVLEKLRASLKKRGAEGIRGLSRHFKIVDRDNSKSIDADEFAQLCKLNRLGLNEGEQRVLMRAFDRDRNGSVNYEEFLRGVRGRLSSTRKKMVRQIFDALDKIGGDLGYLTIASVQPIYSVSKHPQVLAGKMSKEEALQEFLNGFEGSEGDRDGRITLDEFIKYYEEVSCSIDSDDYFGTMIAGTWAHLKKRTNGGKAQPVVKYVAKADIDRLEKQLRAYIYAKVPNDQNTKRQVQKAFGDFDVDGSGAVSIGEFIKALERFGMHCAGQRPGVGGLPMDVVQVPIYPYLPCLLHLLSPSDRSCRWMSYRASLTNTMPTAPAQSTTRSLRKTSSQATWSRRCRRRLRGVSQTVRPAPRTRGALRPRT